ncbi:hypothetical protein NSERUTF1_5749 [Nocardia seriolae]|nr:hypothetical protein NSERUTF1_5749 [Nocardia seriolae]
MLEPSVADRVSSDHCSPVAGVLTRHPADSARKAGSHSA